jgi:pyruvate/2-oxoglutarate dehydrogenase complex dihydrolipoamide acyltransferase (E2) component
LVLIILVTLGSIIGSLTKDSGTESTSNQASSSTQAANLEDQQQEADRRRKEREQQLAAIREKPEEALARAKKLRKDGNFNEALALLKDIREAVPDFPDVDGEIARTVEMSEEARQTILLEQQKERDKAQKAANLAARRLTESMLRERYLDAGLDIKVKVSGKNAERIKLTYALFSDVWSHRMSKDGSVIELCNLGFKRIEMSDGYDWGIYWTCP